MEKNPGGRPRKWYKEEDLQADVNNYLVYCEEKEKPITVLGFCVFCDMSRETLNQYDQGNYNDENNNFSDATKRFKDKVEAYAHERLFEGKNPAGIIFSLKNNFGWTDKKEIDINSVQDINVTISMDDEEAEDQ